MAIVAPQPRVVPESRGLRRGQQRDDGLAERKLHLHAGGRYSGDFGRDFPWHFPFFWEFPIGGLGGFFWVMFIGISWELGIFRGDFARISMRFGDFRRFVGFLWGFGWFFA